MLLWLSWDMRCFKMATGQSAPQGVEKVHCECKLDTESNDRGNNTLWSTLILIWKRYVKKTGIIIIINYCSYSVPRDCCNRPVLTVNFEILNPCPHKCWNRKTSMNSGSKFCFFMLPWINVIRGGLCFLQNIKKWVISCVLLDIKVLMLHQDESTHNHWLLCLEVGLLWWIV